MKIGDWIDAQEPAVPAGFRARLKAEGPASAAGFAAAAGEALDEALHSGPKERAATASARARDPSQPAPDERDAAYSLLAADAYVTYACLLALREDDAAAALEEIAAALSKPPPTPDPPPAAQRRVPRRSA